MRSILLELPKSLATASVAVAILLLTSLIAPSPAIACGGKPAPFCGKTLILSQAGPSVILLPGGGTFDIPLTVYFDIFNFPASASLCPAGPYTVDVELTVTCTPAGDGGGSLLTIPLSIGYNDLTVPVTLPAGPPRVCVVAGEATTLFSDGMELTATSDSLACLGDPAPDNPSLPRLDMELISGDAISRVHPGDQSAFVYRITNNDPDETYSGMLGIEMINSSRLPGMSGPVIPGAGGFAISDPGLGDNFPIGFAADLIGGPETGCLPLPPDPSLPIIPMIAEPILLPPGQFIEVDAFARPWGMCADGSCGRAKVLLDGTFSDSSPGIACSGFVSAADVTVPPLYLWPDSGQAMFIQPPQDPFLGRLTGFGEILPGAGVMIDMVMLPPQLAIDDQPPLPIPPQFFSEPVNDTQGRTQVHFENPEGLFQVDSFFDIFYRIDLLPSQGEPFETELLQMQLVPGAPTGFENQAPFGVGELGIRPPGDPDFFGFLQLMPQVSGLGLDENGEARDLIFELVEMNPSGDGVGFDIHLRGQVAPGTGNQILALDLFQDFRGFLAQQLELPCPDCDIFGDGFESGNTNSWSSTVP